MSNRYYRYRTKSNRAGRPRRISHRKVRVELDELYFQGLGENGDVNATTGWKSKAALNCCLGYTRQTSRKQSWPELMKLSRLAQNGRTENNLCLSHLTKRDIATMESTPDGAVAMSFIRAMHTRFRDRCMYEWFYSSLDEAFFKDTGASAAASVYPLSFEGCLRVLRENGLQIEENQPLTRLEWSTVRERMKMAPFFCRIRRFSPNFIQEQKQLLEIYRSEARNFQVGANLTDLDEFPYEVPEGIDIGQRVTAIHPTTYQLATGVVVNAFRGSNLYDIQFDMRALGLHRCPDTSIRVSERKLIVEEPLGTPSLEDIEKALDKADRSLSIKLKRWRMLDRHHSMIATDIPSPSAGAGKGKGGKKSAGGNTDDTKMLMAGPNAKTVDASQEYERMKSAYREYVKQVTMVKRPCSLWNLRDFFIPMFDVDIHDGEVFVEAVIETLEKKPGVDFLDPVVINKLKWDLILMKRGEMQTGGVELPDFKQALMEKTGLDPSKHMAKGMKRRRLDSHGSSTMISEATRSDGDLTYFNKFHLALLFEKLLEVKKGILYHLAHLNAQAETFVKGFPRVVLQADLNPQPPPQVESQVQTTQQQQPDQQQEIPRTIGSEFFSNDFKLVVEWMQSSLDYTNTYIDLVRNQIAKVNAQSPEEKAAGKKNFDEIVAAIVDGYIDQAQAIIDDQLEDQGLECYGSETESIRGLTKLFTACLLALKDRKTDMMYNKSVLEKFFEKIQQICGGELANLQKIELIKQSMTSLL